MPHRERTRETNQLGRCWLGQTPWALAAVYRVKNLLFATSWMTQTRSEKLNIAIVYQLLSL